MGESWVRESAAQHARVGYARLAGPDAVLTGLGTESAHRMPRQGRHFADNKASLFAARAQM